LIAAVFGLAVLRAWASPWALVVCVGVAAAAFVLVHPMAQVGRLRYVLGLVAIAVVVAGGIGLLVEHLRERADRAASYKAAGDYTRAQMLPDTPTQALPVLSALASSRTSRSSTAGLTELRRQRVRELPLQRGSALRSGRATA
jgi:hypothetical protein